MLKHREQCIAKVKTNKMCATNENTENKKINTLYARTPPHGPGLLARSKASVKKKTSNGTSKYACENGREHETQKQFRHGRMRSRATNATTERHMHEPVCIKQILPA